MADNDNNQCPCGSGRPYDECCKPILNEMKEVSAAFAAMPTIEERDAWLEQLSEDLGLGFNIRETINKDLKEYAAADGNREITVPNSARYVATMVMMFRIAARSNKMSEDGLKLLFCGLNIDEGVGWFMDQFNEFTNAEIDVPDNITKCPVMRYLGIILDEAAKNGGKVRVKDNYEFTDEMFFAAEKLMQEFEIRPEHAKYMANGVFAGRFKGYEFRALNYSKHIMRLAGIIDYVKEDDVSYITVDKEVLDVYAKEGLSAMYYAMLRSAVQFHAWTESVDGVPGLEEIQILYLFMCWRILNHGSIPRLKEEVLEAYPEVYMAAAEELKPGTEKRVVLNYFDMALISRLFDVFLVPWGFVEGQCFDSLSDKPQVCKPTQLMRDTFKFDV